MVTSTLGRLVRGAAGLLPGHAAARCHSMEARSEAEILGAARRLAPARVGSGYYEHHLRRLAELNTPALLLNIVEPSARVHVLLRPWEGRSVRFRGRGYFLDAGSEAPEGMEAFTTSPGSHVTVLYPTVPDHPVYVMSIEHQKERVYAGDVPQYLTHVTIMVNGIAIAVAASLLHERGPQVWAA
jgi:hypothetical protein